MFLSDHPRFGEVAGRPWDDGKPTFIVGGGPSLLGFDFKRLRGRGHIIGVNQAMFDAPCDVGVSMDYHFIRHNAARLCDSIEQDHTLYLVLGDRWGEVLDPIDGATYIRAEPHDGLSLSPGAVRDGGTSGSAALNVAVLKRAKRIVLLGFDYRVSRGRRHYHDEYFWHRQNEQNWPALGATLRCGCESLRRARCRGDQRESRQRDYGVCKDEAE